MSTIMSDRNGGPISMTKLRKSGGGGGVTMISISSSSLNSSEDGVGTATDSLTNQITSPPPHHTKNHKPAMTGSTCMVCHDVAPPGTTFRRHYGVICCEACKCFFRRTVQMNRDYKCRYGSSCSIGRNAENLKQVCQACRFNQCITAGMKLDSVKKFPRKQQRSSTTDDGPGSSSGKKTTKDRQGKRHKSSSTNKDGTVKSTTTAAAKEAPPTINGTGDRGEVGVAHGTSASDGLLSPPAIKVETNLRLSETDLANLKFNVSPPEAMMYLNSNTTVPQLFSYGGSLENINDQSSTGSPSKFGTLSSSSSGDLTRSSSNPNLSRSGSATGMGFEVVSIPGISAASSTSGDGNTIDKLAGMIKHAQTGRTDSKDYLQLPPTLTLPRGGDGRTLELEHEDQLGRNLLSLSETKRQRLDSSSSAVVLGSYYPSGPSDGMMSLSAPHTPITPAPPHLLPHHHSHAHSQPPSRGHSPDPYHGNVSSSVYSSHNPTPYATPHATPHHTPHATPVHTPIHSPLPSPSPLPSSKYQYPSASPSSQLQNVTAPPLHQQHMQQSCLSGFQNLDTSQQKRVVFAPSSSTSSVNPLSISGFSTSNNILLPPQANALFLNAQNTQVPFRVVPMTTPPQLIGPLLQFSPSFTSSGDLSSSMTSTRQFGIQAAAGHMMSSGKSPFTIVPIPSINKTQPDELPTKAEKTGGRLGEQETVPSSSRASSATGKSKSKPIAPLPEAKLEEVLDSLRLRIRHMFTWAKTEVAGFEDLSPLDQKALLRRTVAELVMLGTARGSIAYDDMLLLGSTGKVMRPTNQNSGVASVASVTIQKLVVPLKVLNISDRELTFLKEIVLFNPESNGLRNREVVRQYRKKRHIELMEYTEKNSDDPGRFGELICLLTPLFEVSTEVTEQLRLEQFVHEGEARIDALLLMSMISGNEEMPAESPLVT